MLDQKDLYEPLIPHRYWDPMASLRPKHFHIQNARVDEERRLSPSS